MNKTQETTLTEDQKKATKKQKRLARLAKLTPKQVEEKKEKNKARRLAKKEELIQLRDRIKKLEAQLAKKK